MCGLAGFISPPEQPQEREDILLAMGRAMARRGPDDEGTFDDKHLALIFRRLSIVDLKGGQQPIWNADKTVFVVVNGEIYNHTELRQEHCGNAAFQSRSDSEIVLHLYLTYGEQCFELLNGMFAIAIYETQTRKLFLARDRLGIKPLYIYHGKDGLIFGSELKALLQHPQCPRDISWKDAETIGVSQRNPVPTYIKNIYHLAPGTYEVFDKNLNSQKREFWHIGNFMADSVMPENTLPEYTSAPSLDVIQKNYDSLLENSVKKRLMSDVPVGLFLSGGIDSSLIAALAARHTNNLHCFTVVNKTTVKSGDAPQARQVCEELGIPLYAADMDFENIANAMTLRDFEQSILMIESPRFDAEWYLKNKLYAFAKSQVPDIKVILLGQGADEFSGGYSKLDDNSTENWQHYIDSIVKPDLAQTEWQEDNMPVRFRTLLGIKHQTLSVPSWYQKKMIRLTYQMQHHNLWLEDRASSFQSIEARVPFLDHRLVELLAKIPEPLQETLFWDKQIVRGSLQKYHPSYPLNHPKIPFIYSAKDKSLHGFLVQVVRNLFPAFKVLYIETDRCRFDTHVLTKKFSIIEENRSDSIHRAIELLDVMSITVFERILYNPDWILDMISEEQESITRRIPNENLPEAFKAYLSAADPAIPEYRLDTVLRIQAGLKVANNIREGELVTQIFGIAEDQILLNLEIPNTDFWAIELLEILANSGLQGKSIEQLVSQLNIESSRLVDGIYFLQSHGFVEQVGV